MNERGQIQNRERRKQIFDMRSLLYGKITPTDLDAMIEYKNTGFVLIEAKYKQDFYQEMGQQLAHERMARALWIANKPTVLIFARHDIANPASDVDLSTCQVTQYYYCGKWHRCNRWTVKQITDSFIRHLDNLIQARQLQFNAQASPEPALHSK